MYICMDGWLWAKLHESMHVSICMYVNIYVCACLQIHTGMHAYGLQFLARCLSSEYKQKATCIFYQHYPVQTGFISMNDRP